MTACPRCKHPFAYVGARMVECPNSDCKNYSERQEELWEASPEFQAELDKQAASSEQETLDSEDQPDHSPVYLWCHRFNDFGD